LAFKKKNGLFFGKSFGVEEKKNTNFLLKFYFFVFELFFFEKTYFYFFVKIPIIRSQKFI